MRKKKGKSHSFYIGFFIIITLISSVISYNYINSRQELDLTTEEIEEIPIKTSEDYSEAYDIKDFLNVTDDVFIESYHGPSDIIELDEQEIRAIANIFKNHDMQYIIASDNKERSYLYAVHIKNKQVKVKLSQSHLLFENPDKVLLYSIENEGLKDLIAELEEIYMAKYNNQDLFHQADRIKIMSKDEGMEWELNPEEIDALESAIYLISPIGENEVVGIPRRYPNYLMNIKTNDKDYTINLFTEDILSIDSGDSITYYEYKSHLWEYIKKTYTVNKNYTKKDFQYLLESSKVVIDAKNDNFDMEDDTYYPVEIPRYIISAGKRPLKEPMTGDSLVFSIIFTVRNEELKVEIYENQIIFGEQAYFSEKIGEAILSVINV